jgi:type I restriction enzyme M protein
MNAKTHSQLANFIWSVCNLFRGPYKRNEYRKVILPLTVLRRFDCLLAPTKAQVLKEHTAIKGKPENMVRSLLEKVTGRPFYNPSKLDFTNLPDDPNQLASNLNGYISMTFPIPIVVIVDDYTCWHILENPIERNVVDGYCQKGNRRAAS